MAATTPPGAASGSRRELLLAAVLIFFNSFSFFLIQYDRMRTQGPGIESWLRYKFSGVLSEGDQYRIGMPYLTRFLELHTPLKPTQSIPLIEFLAYALALVLLYLLVRSSPRMQTASPSYRFAVLGFFFAAVQLPVLWIFPWERTETLPTAFYLAAIVFLVVRRSRIPFALVCLLAILLTFVQAFFRSDATVISGVAILIAAALNVPFPRPRASTAFLGLLCCAVGGSTQLYLQRVAFPVIRDAQTPSTFQLLKNLNLTIAPLHTPIFLTAILPLMVSLYLLRRYRLKLESSDKLVLLICLIYLAIWINLGLASEVRIFVPYLFLASPTLAKLWTAFLLPDENATQSA
ncbi:MAG: hypothetical protein OK454_05275 [Thaumarchaeota archaeon]|nr:hypothetical protein [Nitrososphaerota archaeon]